VSWNILAGPISSISLSGLATAANVYQNTLATVQGSFLGRTGTLGLTVLNVGFDDYGTYAGDGLPDDWQVQYFGENNPAGGAGADPDGDGQNNKFEYTAGLIPTDPNSVFRLRIEPVFAQPTHKNLLFSPRFADRTYIVQFRLSLIAGNWQPLPGTTQADVGLERTVTDLNAVEPEKFYRVEITKP